MRRFYGAAPATIQGFLAERCCPSGSILVNLPVTLGVGCREYMGHRDAGGYGAFKLKKKGIQAHRYAYVLANGSIPVDRPIIMHLCNNPACCELTHLKAGTHAENNAYCKECKRTATGDRHGLRLHPERHPSRLHPEEFANHMQKMRHSHRERKAHGEQHGLAKLTDEHVLDIRARCAQGEPKRALARRYDVTPPTIIAIIQGRTWKHLISDHGNTDNG